MTQRPLPLNVDLALWLKCGLLREVGYTSTGIVSYELTPAGRALIANRLAAEDNFPTSRA